MSTTESAGSAATTPKRTAGAFDIRVFIGSLLGFFGVVLTITGLWFTDDAAKAKVNGENLNLQVGIALVVVGIIFIAWAVIRPVIVPVDVDRDAVDEHPR